MNSTIHQQYDLSTLNTFAVPAVAEHYAGVRTKEEVLQILDSAAEAPSLILGGGSNVLLLGDIPGLVLHNQMEEIQISDQDANTVWVSAGAGVNWHQLVLWTLRQGFGGLENLALIPGTVGAAPIQNIGAYGVELRDVFEQLTAIELGTGNEHVFKAADCAFGYRDSVFKATTHKGRFLITSVTLRLSRNRHQLNMEYGAIRDMLQQLQIADPAPADVARAVIEIRRSKLPDWHTLGNAGSFFKNPVISAAAAEQLLVKHPKMPHYPAEEGQIKVPAAWLIDQCGWKGKRKGPVGCYEKQALVIVNHGGATGKDVLNFSREIQHSVAERFNVKLEREVNAVGGDPNE